MNAGFNNKTNTTWLPLHPDYRSINVKVQNSPKLKKHLARGAFNVLSYLTFPSRPRRKTRGLFWLSTVP